MRHLLKDSNGVVLNFVEYDGVSPLEVPAGTTLVASDEPASIGKTVAQHAADEKAHRPTATTTGGPSVVR